MMKRRQQVLFVLTSWALIFGFTPALCGEKTAELTDAEARSRSAVAVDPKVLLDAYLKAKQLTSSLAAEVARRELAVIEKSCGGKDWGSYYNTTAYKRLLVVASDAWPYLRDEWKRTLVDGKKRKALFMRFVIAGCWHATVEERALGMLAECAIAEKRPAFINIVQSISGRGSVIFFSTPIDPKNLKQLDKFAKWWKTYKPGWHGRMLKREEATAPKVGASVAGGSKKDKGH
jgi:hypothetical protein